MKGVFPAGRRGYRAIRPVAGKPSLRPFGSTVCKAVFRLAVLLTVVFDEDPFLLENGGEGLEEDFDVEHE